VDVHERITTTGWRDGEHSAKTRCAPWAKRVADGIVHSVLIASGRATVQCIILAGGLGTRMSHRAAGRSKAMIEVAGEPFIRHQLRALHDSGVSDVVICVGYRAEEIEAEVADHAPAGMSVRCSRDGDQLLGTAGAVRRAVAAGLTQEAFIVMKADSYLRLDVAEVWEWFDSQHHDGLMAVWHDESGEGGNAAVRNGRVVVYRRGVARFGHPTMEFVNYGVGIITADAILELVPSDGAHDLAVLYSALAGRGRLQAFEVDQPFLVIDERWHDLDGLLGSDLHPWRG
jgi:NDP-sugar pyrophosphorylase family protein